MANYSRTLAFIAVFASLALLFGCLASAPQSAAEKSNGSGLAKPAEAQPPSGAIPEKPVYSLAFRSNYPLINKTISGTVELDMKNREFCVTNSRKEVVMCIVNKTYYFITNVKGNCTGTYLKYDNDALLDAERCSLVTNPLVFRDQLYPFMFTLCKNYSNIVNKDGEAEYLRMRSEIGMNLSTRLNASGTEISFQYAGVDGLAIPSGLEWKENGETTVKTTYTVLGKMGSIGLLDGINASNCMIRDAAGTISEVE